MNENIRERGSNLSAGQRQLLSFARALAYDPGILVMDEATSSVDSETERLIQLAMVHLLEGRTALVVAHRLSTIEKADRIMVLSHGELRESGTHEELLAAAVCITACSSFSTPAFAASKRPPPPKARAPDDNCLSSPTLRGSVEFFITQCRPSGPRGSIPSPSREREG